MHKISFSKRLTHLWLILVVFALGSLADVMDFSAQHYGWMSVIGIVSFAILKAFALTAVYSICRKQLALKALAILIISIFILLSTLNGGCWLFYGFGISRKLLTIIAETNPNELKEFFPELADKFLALLSSYGFWIFIILFLEAWIWIPKISDKLQVFLGGIISAIGGIYFIVVLFTTSAGRRDYSIFARSYHCFATYMRDRRIVKELETQKLPLPFCESLASSNAANRIVLVIGESASRDHLSLYGYPLPTTPRLDTISQGLYSFGNAIASSTSTAQNMPRLITFMTDEPEGKEWYEYPSLLQIFHSLGYHTYWLSNQEYSGKWSNLSGILSSDADVVKYVGSIDSEDHYLVRYDDILIPEWQKAMTSSDSLQLVVLHLMGSHFQYSHRYSKSRQHISSDDVRKNLPRKWLNNKKAEIIADYDNSILFTDSILSVLIEGIRKEEKPTAMVYVSDHGENVYDDRDYRGRDPQFVKVPFIIYVNEAYQQKNMDIIEEIEKSLSNPFSTSELPQLLLHLSGSDYKLYDPQRDPISEKFTPRIRFVDDNAYDIRNTNMDLFIQGPKN